MKRMVIAAMWLGGGLAMAQEEEGQSEGPVEELQIRLGEMEQIVVTAEKAPVNPTEDFDSEIELILLDADALEDESEE